MNISTDFSTLEVIIPYLPLILPLAIIQFGLMMAALLHAVKHQRFKYGNLIIWVIIIVMVSLIGPVLYFVIGRDDEAGEDD